MIGSVIAGGFMLGFAGSLHCVGMCGPLSLALPVHHLSGTARFFSLLLYQLGRTSTYAMIGLIFGLAGRSVYIAGYQQAFSITMGLVIVLFALFYVLRKPVKLKFFNKYFYFVQELISTVVRSSRGPGDFYLMGMANGLLPCGMVYVAMMATLAYTEIRYSILFMILFGLGTIPAMLMAAYGARLLKPSFGIRVRRLVPVFIAAMGIMLILRGLNLGITFLSPAFPHGNEQPVICHP